MKRNEVMDLLKDIEMDESVQKSLVDGIMKLHGNDINTLKESHENEVNELKTATTTEIEGFKTALSKFEGVDVDELTKAVDDWQTKYNDLLETHNAEVRTRAIKDTLVANGCRDVDYILYKIGTDSFHFDEDGKIDNADSIISKTKESFGDWFGDKTVVVPTIAGQPIDDTADYANMSDEDYYSQMYSQEG